MSKLVDYHTSYIERTTVLFNKTPKGFLMKILILLLECKQYVNVCFMSTGNPALKRFSCRKCQRKFSLFSRLMRHFEITMIKIQKCRLQQKSDNFL